jgi:mannose-1-phosphate guanylyltransferase
MKAIILAAGRGTRIRPLTFSYPKPMIPIINKPVMELLVEHLARHDFRELMVNTSYMASAIEGYFRDGNRFGVEMAYSFEGRLENGQLLDEPMGSAGAIKLIQERSGFFDEAFAVLCGDALIDLDLTRLLEIHRAKGALVTIALAQVPCDRVSSYGIVVTDGDGRVQDFQEKPLPEDARSDMANTGIYIFEPAVAEHIPAGQQFDIGGELFPLLVEQGEPVYAVDLPFQWLDIGQITDYHGVIQKVLQGEVNNVPVPGREAAAGLWTGINTQIEHEGSLIVPPVYVGPGSTIRSGATVVGPTMIGPNSVIEAGAHVERSVIFDYTRVGPGANLTEMLVCGGYCANAEGTVLNLAGTDIGWVISDARAATEGLTELQQLVQDALRQMASPDAVDD